MTFAALLAPIARAAEPEQLDEEFLEFLAEFADADDDWSWFASDDDDEAAKKESQRQAAKPAPQSADKSEKVKP